MKPEKFPPANIYWLLRKDGRKISQGDLAGELLTWEASRSRAWIIIG